MAHPYDEIYDQGFAAGMEAAWDPDFVTLWPDPKRTAREIVAKWGLAEARKLARVLQAQLTGPPLPPPGTQLPMFE
jgi:hypothetical protein